MKKKASRLIKITEERYNDLLSSESALKELGSYSVKQKYENMFEKSEKNILRIEKSENTIPLRPDWQKGVLLFYKILFTVLNSYNNFANSLRVFKRKNRRKQVVKNKTELTPLESKLYKFCAENEIDLTKSVRSIWLDVDAKGFRNLKHKKGKLHLSTVGKMLKKIRP